MYAIRSYYETSFYKNIKLNLDKATLRNTPDKLADGLLIIHKTKNFSTIKPGIIRDLAVLGFITLNNGKYVLTEIGESININAPEISILKQAYKLSKIKITTDYIVDKGMSKKAKNLIVDIPQVIDKKLKESSYNFV